MLDMPASGLALWELSDATGVRPEYLLPVLAYESGLDPNADNGVGFVGINQESVGQLRAMGIDPNDYKTWSASAQIRAVVIPRYKGLTARYGPLSSGARVYQANFLPGTLGSAKTLNSVIASQHDDPQHFYRDNASLDRNRDRFITLGDLASLVAHVASDPYVRDAIAKVYALRPGETMRDPALGTDFSSFSLKEALMLGGAAIALASAVSYAWGPKRTSSKKRRYVRRRAPAYA